MRELHVSPLGQYLAPIIMLAIIIIIIIKTYLFMVVISQ